MVDSHTPSPDIIEVNQIHVRIQVVAQASRGATHGDDNGGDGSEDDGFSCASDMFLCEAQTYCCPSGYLCEDSSACIKQPQTTSSALCGPKTDYYACPLTTGPGSCCPIGLECNTDGGCVVPVTTISDIPNVGLTTITKWTTVPGILMNATSEASRVALTNAEIGGIVGGVVGFAVVLGILVWLIMRRLNDVMRLVKTRLGSGENDSGKEPQVETPNQHTTPEPPSEIWDPHSDGRYPYMARELAGSYEAHGVLEIGDGR